ncbi:hypothetical protein [Aeromonas media]|uniref:hypothetical protein n=1 Tax=Aeromonas media TaxID=651 RepID=UPI0015DC0747|nr:hypothetical protein [Aeromonas media]BBS86627.1 hypothetical protein WP7W18E02_15240 [Aeromonas media]
MAFKKSSSRKLPQSDITKSNLPTPISIEAMVINTPAGKCYFKRLQYKGCPATSNASSLNPSGALPPSWYTNMHRDDEIRMLYEIFLDRPINSSTKNYFNNICGYIRSLDAADRTFNFSKENVMWYGQEIERLMKLGKMQGGITGGVAANRKAAISMVLKAKGLHNLARMLPSILVRDTIPHPTLDDDNFTEIGKFLHRGYRGYMAILKAGSTPTLCQLFDEERLMKLEKSKSEIIHQRGIAKRRAKPSNGDWRNSLVRIAMLLTYMFTGINPTPLYSLRRCDVKFKKGVGNHYELDTIKHRAFGQKQTNELGFTHYSKDFFESWLSATESWSNDLNTPVFPRFTADGKIKTWNVLSPQGIINNILTTYKLPKVTASIFRKTRSQMLMRVLNDPHAVADANNNSIETTSKDYLYGVEAHHDLANAGASKALFKLAKGENKAQVIAEFEQNCKDPLTSLEFLKEKKQLPQITQTGLCCWQPSTDKIAKEKTKYRNINKELDMCIDFIGCFDCPSHALIADADNIWMMLSFYDTVRQVLSRPAYNSTPSEHFHHLEIKTKIILDKLRHKAPKAYFEAEEMNRIESHPLYNDSNSIDDLLRVYK